MKLTGAARRIRSAVSRVLIFGATLAVALSVTSSTSRVAARGGQLPPDDNGIAASAAVQIESLLREKESRSPAEQKIDSQLLYAWRMQQGLPVAPGVQTLEVGLPYAADGHVIVDVSATSLSPNLLSQLNGLSPEVKRTGPRDLQVHVALSQVERIAAEPEVLFVQPRQGAHTSRVGPRPSRDGSSPMVLPPLQVDMPPQETLVGTGVGSVSSQADLTHRAPIFRALSGANGSGVKIGVLSDDVCNLAAAQASGDLGAVTVLPGQTGDCTAPGDEGTAMLELIHDMAPGAQLYFATGFTSITSFAQNIRDLRAAGCDIIVDDVGYFVESPFQDGQTPAVVSPNNAGVVTQAVKDVTFSGALYFSAAGNGGNFNDGTGGVWEGDFLQGAATGVPIPGGSAGSYHRFFTLGQDFNTLTAAVAAPISLHWSDPLGGSANDYDLFRLNAAGTVVAQSSTNIQNGNDDPYEQFSHESGHPRLVIVKKTGAAGRFLHLNTNGGRLAAATAGQTHGHNSTSSIFSFGVAAVNTAVSFPDAFSTGNVVETFSSDGPRRMFYHGDGTVITPGNVSASGGILRQKPDMAAGDGAFVTGAGDFPGQFFGTSAAAANAAAIAALIKSANPAFSQAQLRSALIASALDIETAGIDRDSGAGIVMANPPQPGCTFASVPSIGVSASGGVGGIHVTASSPSCAWAAYSNVPWTIVTNGVGVGNGTFNLTTPTNRGPARSGTINVGGNAIPISQSGPAATAFNNNSPLAIADGTRTESNLTVSGLTQPITSLSVSFYLTHTFDSELRLSLIGPDGTFVRLSTENGGSANNYGNACTAGSRTTFAESAAVYITHASAPFIGSFRPEQRLSLFNGKSGAAANGTWNLRIEDTSLGEVGTLHCWSLHINQGAAPGVTNDFNGNGASDLAVFRPANGQWFINGGSSPSFGLPGDVPVPGDYNGDGVAGVAVYRPATGEWFVSGGSPGTIQFGLSGDVPVPADYDGDKKTDTAVYRCTSDSNQCVWFLNIPGQAPVLWGLRGDIPMPGDYDGDTRADLAVYRPATGQWFIAYAASGFTTTRRASWGIPGDIPVRADLDNDQRLDFVVFRPSTGTWFMAPTNSVATSVVFGLPGDVPLSLDVDGDGFAELCVWRPATGTWFIHNRVTTSTSTVQFGLFGDIPVGARPRLPNLPVSDFDGDGLSDITVFRPSSATWFTRFSATGFSTSASTQFGLSTDIPVNGDYDGDRRSDLAVYRPSSGQWFILQSSTGTLRTANWGVSTDKPLPADYDGDGRTDLAIYRPSLGQWFILFSSTNTGTMVSWGLSTDTPFATDFDGDGRADLGVYRPSTGQWFLNLSTATFGQVIIRQWGAGGDVPVSADFDGDGRSEIAVFRPSTGEWFGIDPITTAFVVNRQWGINGDITVPHDYDGDGVNDTAVFRPSIGQWFIRRSATGTLLNVPWGLSGDIPR